MVVEIALVCLVAKLRHLKLRYLFRTWTIYPILISQFSLLVFQGSIFLRSTYFLPVTPFVEFGMILSFSFAMFVFKLYKPALLGTGSVLLGTVLNKAALAANGGKMPAYPTLSYLTGYMTPEFLMGADQIHTMGNADTKLKFLTDYIDYGYCVLSPGDVLIHLFACFMLYSMIRAVNDRYGRPEPESLGEV